MVIIRLQRVGRTNDPSFRVVVVESKRGPQSGAFIEILGSYDARNKRTDLKADRIKYWLSQGAQLSATMHNLLIKNKVIEGDTINVVRPPKKAPEAAPAAAPTA